MNSFAGIPIIKNHDSRRMQPLRWEVWDNGKTHDLISRTGKVIATFWGNDDRLQTDKEWCTAAQRGEHAAYAAHACNHFPLLQDALEAVYALHDMPKAAKALIEAVMNKSYLEGVPPHVK